ncbi:MAG: hypothetical protein QOK35_229, partial [Pseudonocardiales bacterium]|nr:hypothetical protein [Pseudonocardiales bacterium]
PVGAGPVGAAGGDGTPTSTVAGPPPRIAVVEVAGGSPPALVVRAHERARRAQVVFAVAGLVFGLASTAVYHRVSGDTWALRPVLVQVLLLSWLAVPTVIALGFPDRRVRMTVWAAYLGAVVLLAASDAVARAAALDFLIGVVAVPGLFVLATAARTLRGAAWFVAPALVVLGLMVAAAYPPLLQLWYGVALDRSSWILMGAVVGLPALVGLYGAVVTLLYARKWASDDTLLILQWWFVLGLTQVILLGTQGATAAVWALAPFAVMTLLLLGVALVVRRGPTEPPARLLLLRTFGDRNRSSRLLRDVTVLWRWIGSVDLITGTDLATEVLEPHEFLDYLRGRLRRHFVRGPADLVRRIDELDLRPDLDGRYRVNEMLCHDDTWRPALAALVHEVDAVLIDLRGLTPRRTGVVYEIERLVAEVPMHRVVALTDATTDRDVLRWALDRAAAQAPADAPVRNDPAPALRTVALTGRWSTDLATMLGAVGRAAARPAITEAGP